MKVLLINLDQSKDRLAQQQAQFKDLELEFERLSAVSIHDFSEEGIRVEKARWGRSVILKGKVKIELSKDIDASALTLEEIQKMIEEKAPAKKTATKKPAVKKTATKTTKTSTVKRTTKK